MSSSEKQIYRFEDVEVNLSNGCLKRGESQLHLRRKSLQVLVYLIQQRERLVSKDELVENVWQEAAVTDDTIVQCVKEIRRALGDDSTRPRFIKTFPKSGYRFIGLLEEQNNGSQFIESDSSSPPSPSVKETVSPAFSIYDFFRRRKILIAALFLATGIFSFGLVGRNLRQTEQKSPEITLPQTEGKKTLVVMFFENQSSSAELEWLRKGIADMLITDLSRSSKLDVLSRQQFSVLLEKSGIQPDDDVSFEQAVGIARKSRATNFITGSFAKAGEKIRLDVQLFDAQNGSLLGAENLIVDKPEQILTEIDLLSLKLTRHWETLEPENQARVADVMTNNLEAYRFYSTALEKTQALHNEEAINLLEKAVALDPQFALAHARIGYTYAVSWGQVDKGKPYLEKAFGLSNRLTEKDRLNIAAWYAIANLDYQAAIQSYREIIARYPLETEAYWRLGRLLAGEERMEEAIAVLRQGLTVDGEAKDIYNTLGGTLSCMGRHDEAVAARQRYVALAPAEPNAYDSLGMVYQWAGDYEKAIENYDRALELNPKFEVALIHLANTRFQMGQYRSSIELFKKYIEIAPSENERVRGYIGLSVVYLAKKDFAAAKKTGGLAAKITKANIWELLVIPLERGDLSKAKKFALSPMANRGARGSLRFDFFSHGYLALKNGQADEAIANFKEAIRQQPPTWNIDAFEDCLAKAYLELGQFDLAIAECERILRLNPNYPLARFHLAQSFERKGLRDQAVENYQQFLQIWKDADGDIPEIIAARKFIAES